MSAEGADADITHGRGTFLAECFVDLRDGEILDVFIFFIIAGHFETSVEEGLFYRPFGVSGIVSHKATFLCWPEPVTLTYIHLILELRIDLRMVDAHTLYSFGQLCGDESARTGRVGKNLPIVGRADERRYALLLLVFVGAASLVVGICSAHSNIYLNIVKSTSPNQLMSFKSLSAFIQRPILLFEDIQQIHEDVATGIPSKNKGINIRTFH